MTDDIMSWQYKGYPVQATWFPGDSEDQPEPGDAGPHVVVAVFARGEEVNPRCKPQTARVIAEGCRDSVDDALTNLSPVGVLLDPELDQLDVEYPY